MFAFMKDIPALLAPLSLGVVHVHEDVVFVEHNLFLFLLPAGGLGPITLIFNAECPPDLAARAAVTIFEAARKLSVDVVLRGTYEMEEAEDEQLKLVLLPENPWPTGPVDHPAQ